MLKVGLLRGIHPRWLPVLGREGGDDPSGNIKGISHCDGTLQSQAEEPREHGGGACAAPLKPQNSLDGQTLPPFRDKPEQVMEAA